jgi:hypothetical protein
MSVEVTETIDSNEEQILAMLKLAMPDLYAILVDMHRYDIPSDMVIDFLSAIHRVRTQGWGTVILDVRDGQVKAIEAKTTKIYAIERYSKNI